MKFFNSQKWNNFKDGLADYAPLIVLAVFLVGVYIFVWAVVTAGIERAEKCEAMGGEIVYKSCVQSDYVLEL